jgi:DNA polymerase-3 subunit epsilon
MFWACSMKDIPWESEGFKGRSLEWLAFAHCQMFYDAHRADSDCYMGVHLLATPLPSGGPALAALLRSARTQYVRVWAISAPFEAKGALKKRGYGWSPGESGRPKAWYRDVAEDVADAEMVWLGTAVYTNGGAEAVRRDKLDRRLRHSDRVGMPAGSGSSRP